MQITVDSSSNSVKSSITKSQRGIWGYTIDLSLIEDKSRTITHFMYYNAWPIRIDWGDGTVEDYGSFTNPSDSPTHTYAEGQDIFHIRVYSLSGTLSGTEGGVAMYCPFGASTPLATKQAVVSVFSTDVSLRNYQNRELFNGFVNLCYCDYSMLKNRVLSGNGLVAMFRGTKLTHVPDEIFEHQTEATSYANIFAESSLQSPPPIPDCATTLSSAFGNCADLVDPIKKFPANSINISSMFVYCKKLKGPIPQFPAGVTSMGQIFYQCLELNGTIPPLPPGLKNLSTAFDDCRKLTGPVPTIPNTVTNMHASFYNCVGLTGTFPTLPTGLTGSLRYCFTFTKLTGPLPAIPDGITDIRECFKGCSNATSLPSSIPSGLVYVDNAFQSCTNLTGIAPAFWDSSQYPNIVQPTTKSNLCFYGCTGLSNYDDIPALWK